MIKELYAAFAAFLIFTPIIFASPTEKADRPNFILIVADNLGYGDLGCFGSTKHRTPNIDRMAGEGVKLTNFYVASGVCTPSRAALMTGCYPRRVSMATTEPDGAVLRPVSPNGLHPDETTIAEILKEHDYATAIIGKWHLGDQTPFLPTRQGFDYYFGIPYSDDMTPRQGKPWPPLPLMRNEEVIEAPVDRDLLTRRYTEQAIRFIEENRTRPFFLYLAHAMPGSTDHPFASRQFQGQSANGPYGDSVEELDWSTGQILKAIRRFGLDDKTLVIFTSDNGAPRRDPPQGSNLPLSGWGYTTAEGGMRVPAVARWPGKVSPGRVCEDLATAMDILPTYARLAGAKLPDHRIDGRDIWPLMSGRPGSRSPHVAFYYYQEDKLQAVRSGKWKLQLTANELYDLTNDIGETTDVAEQNPQIVAQLLKLAEYARQELGDGERPGSGQRPVGRVHSPKPQSLSSEH